MNQTWIVFLTLLCWSSFPMKKCSSWEDLAKAPLLANQYDDCSHVIAPDQPTQKRSYGNLVELEKTCREASQRKQDASAYQIPDNLLLYKLKQQTCSTYRVEDDLTLETRARVRICIDEDFEEVPNNEKKELILTAALHEKYSSIMGKVFIESEFKTKEKTCSFDGSIYTNFNISAIALHPSGMRIAIAGNNSYKNCLLIYQLDHGYAYHKIHSLISKHVIKLVAFSPSGNTILLVRSYIQNQTIYNYGQVLSLDTKEIVMELDEFDRYAHDPDFTCGWIDENKIIGIIDENNAYFWPINSEAATNRK